MTMTHYENSSTKACSRSSESTGRASNHTSDQSRAAGPLSSPAARLITTLLPEAPYHWGHCDQHVLCPLPTLFSPTCGTDHHLTHCPLYLSLLWLLLLKCKHHEGRDFSLYPLHLTQCQAHRRYLNNMCWNEWVNHITLEYQQGQQWEEWTTHF